LAIRRHGLHAGIIALVIECWYATSRKIWPYASHHAVITPLFGFAPLDQMSSLNWFRHGQSLSVGPPAGQCRWGSLPPAMSAHSLAATTSPASPDPRQLAVAWLVRR